eukprot:2540442-Prymnesium_polylepis.1
MRKSARLPRQMYLRGHACAARHGAAEACLWHHAVDPGGCGKAERAYPPRRARWRTCARRLSAPSRRT